MRTFAFAAVAATVAAEALHGALLETAWVPALAARHDDSPKPTSVCIGAVTMDGTVTTATYPCDSKSQSTTHIAVTNTVTVSAIPGSDAPPAKKGLAPRANAPEPTTTVVFETQTTYTVITRTVRRSSKDATSTYMSSAFSDIPSASSNVPSASDMPVVSSDMPRVSSGTPSIFSGMPSVSSDMPRVSSGMPSVSSSMPGVSSGMPRVSSDLPSVSSDLPSVSSNMPRVSSDMPSISSSMPSISSGMPSVAVDLPSIASGMPSVASDLPSVSSDMPSTSSSMPFNRNGTSPGYASPTLQHVGATVKPSAAQFTGTAGRNGLSVTALALGLVAVAQLI